MESIKEFTRYNVFGWDIFKKQLAAGEDYTTTIATETDFKTVGLTTLWVKGLITGVNVSTNEKTPPRVPGYLTTVTDKIPAGVYEYSVKENTEWWCLPSFANGDDSPTLTAVVLTAGETRTFATGSLLLLIQGEYEIDEILYKDKPLPVDVQGSDLTVTAETNVYGLLFDRKK